MQSVGDGAAFLCAVDAHQRSIAAAEALSRHCVTPKVVITYTHARTDARIAFKDFESGWNLSADRPPDSRTCHTAVSDSIPCENRQQ